MLFSVWHITLAVSLVLAPLHRGGPVADLGTSRWPARAQTAFKAAAPGVVLFTAWPAGGYYARTLGGSALFAEHGVTLHLPGVAQPVAMHWPGVSSLLWHGDHQQPARTHVFLGADPATWHANRPNFARLTATLRPGITIEFVGVNDNLKSTYVLAPGADPAHIAWRYAGARSIHLTPAGAAVIDLPGGTLTESAPIAWQVVGGQRVNVGVRYHLMHDQLTFALEAYDPTRPLWIDPELTFASPLGGLNADRARAVAVDASGFIYVAGATASPDFITTLGAYSRTLAASNDVWVAKFNPNGSGPIYSTFIGGTGDDQALALAVDAAGAVYLTGVTQSADFPTVNAVQATPGGAGDAFALKLNPAGSALAYSTYLGGSATDAGTAVRVNVAGEAYLAGDTRSANLITATGGLTTGVQPSYGGGLSDAFVMRLNAAGNAVLGQTFLGRNALDSATTLALDAAGAVWVAGVTTATNFLTTTGAVQMSYGGGGSDAFATKLTAGLTQTLASTYLGGSGAETARALAVSASGQVYVAGVTNSPDFPVVSAAFATPRGAQDGFVTQINLSGTVTLYSTYLGGSGNDDVSALALDAANHAYVVGQTNSADFPQVNGLQTALRGEADAFAVRLAPAGNALRYATLLGGAASEAAYGVALAADNTAWVVGETESHDFPRRNPVQPGLVGGADAFMAALALTLFPVNVALSDAPGNANGVIDPGEPFTVRVALFNERAATASAITGTLSVLTGSATFTTSVSPYPNITAGGTQTNTTAYFLRVGLNQPCGSALTLLHTVTYSPSLTATHTFTVPVGTPTCTPFPVAPVVGLSAANSSPTPLSVPTRLTATVQSGDAISYSWSLGDASPVQFGSQVTHTYGAPGVYTATVTAQNAANTLTATTLVTVLAAADVALTLDAPPLAVPGAPFTATLAVRNLGPNLVLGTALTAAWPLDWQGVTWGCTAELGATCNNGFGTALADTLDMAANTALTYTLSGTLSPLAVGALNLQALVRNPPETLDTDLGNNAASVERAFTPQADLHVSKTDAQDGATPANNPITYTLIVTNPGPSFAASVWVSDVMPPGIASVIWTCEAVGGATCIGGSGNVLSDTVQMPPDSRITYTGRGTLLASASGTLVNVVRVTPQGDLTDPLMANNIATDTTTLGQVADLAVSATNGQTGVIPADQVITYTFRLSNTGPSALSGVVLTGLFPAALVSPTWQCTASGGATCPVSAMLPQTLTTPVGGVFTFTLAGEVPATLTGTLAAFITATLPPGNVVDSNLSNNSASDVDVVLAQSDLAVSLSNGLTTTTPGLPVTYTLLVSASGPSTAVAAPLLVTFPVALLDPAWACSPCGTSGVGNLQTALTLPAGSLLTYTLTGLIPPDITGTLSVQARLVAPPGLADVNPANAQAADNDILRPFGDVALSLVSTPAIPWPGAPVTYALVVTNTGPSLARDLVVSATLPGALVGPAWACAATPGSQCGAVLTGTGYNLLQPGVAVLGGGAVTYTLSALLPDTYSGTLRALARVTVLPANLIDPNVNNNLAEDDDHTVPVADLSAHVLVPATVIPAGQRLTTTLLISSAGPSVLPGARLVYTAPAGLTGVVWSCPTCSMTAGAGSPFSLTLGFPASTGVHTITINADLPAALTGTLSHQARVEPLAVSLDPVLDNNHATALTALTPEMDLQLAAWRLPAFAPAGGVVTYQVVVSNTGPSAATGAPFTATLPGDLSGPAWQCSAGCIAGTAPVVAVALTVPPGSALTLTLSATVAANAVSGTMLNVSLGVSPSPTASDPNAANNLIAHAMPVAWRVFLPLTRR